MCAIRAPMNFWPSSLKTTPRSSFDIATRDSYYRQRSHPTSAELALKPPWGKRLAEATHLECRSGSSSAVPVQVQLVDRLSAFGVGRLPKGIAWTGLPLPLRGSVLRRFLGRRVVLLRLAVV